MGAWSWRLMPRRPTRPQVTSRAQRATWRPRSTSRRVRRRKTVWGGAGLHHLHGVGLPDLAGGKQGGQDAAGGGEQKGHAVDAPVGGYGDVDGQRGYGLPLGEHLHERIRHQGADGAAEQR